MACKYAKHCLSKDRVFRNQEWREKGNTILNDRELEQHVINIRDHTKENGGYSFDYAGQIFVTFSEKDLEISFRTTGLHRMTRR